MSIDWHNAREELPKEGQECLFYVNYDGFELGAGPTVWNGTGWLDPTGSCEIFSLVDVPAGAPAFWAVWNSPDPDIQTNP